MSVLIFRVPYHKIGDSTHRDLKDPAGWRFSSLRKIRLHLIFSVGTYILGMKRLEDEGVTYHPAALDRAEDSIKGVSTQGAWGSFGAMLPMMTCVSSRFVIMYSQGV